MKMHFDSTRSRIEFVIAPDPKTAARPATVDEWQSRAQWSTCGVLSATRANFCIR